MPMSEMNCRETRGCLPGYELEMFYQPLRGVGGDYFDIIDLPEGRTLIAVADVSGKGMPAALVAANIQALVRTRSITSIGAEPVSLASQINRHLCRYTPSDCFATAIFVVLSRETGDVTYVNAGHNPPILSSSGSATFLASTGMPLGLVSEAEFDSQTVTMPAGAKLLVFTDGLPDGIGSQTPERRICDTLGSEADAKETMLALKALIDPKFNEDDVTILLLRRLCGFRAKSIEVGAKSFHEKADECQVLGLQAKPLCPILRTEFGTGPQKWLKDSE